MLPWVFLWVFLFLHDGRRLAGRVCKQTANTAHSEDRCISTRCPEHAMEPSRPTLSPPALRCPAASLTEFSKEQGKVLKLLFIQPGVVEQVRLTFSGKVLTRKPQARPWLMQERFCRHTPLPLSPTPFCNLPSAM